MLNNLSIINKNKEFMVSLLVIFSCILLSLFFPVSQENILESLTKSLFFLIIIPVFYIKFILKKNLSDFGLNFKHKKKGIFWGCLMLAASLAMAYLILQLPSMKHSYHLPVYVPKNFWIFLIYELIVVNVYFFVSDFFWKGFVLFIFSEKFRYWSIAIQSAIVIGASILNGDFYWKFAALPILSLTGGIVSYKSKSFIFSYIMSLLFIIILDSYLIYNLNK